ncbi:NUDIX domain-containing protein [Patescibacteria group bacterium]|nr:NUDIX domain-containing protein [Patescibacteria group bacterium]MBU4368874.1 NUDIX domain-containing protein [Patescibacteria group bacterium]
MNPKIIIVDENDNIIAHKERENLNAEDIYRVSALWVANSKGEILLARRALTKSHSPGKWGPAAAGTVEEGEDYYSNIIKEAKEELGLENIKPKTGPKIRVAKNYNYFCQWYLLEIDKPLNEFKIQKSEVEELKWISKKELLDEIKNNPDDFVESMKESVKLLTKKII